MKDNNKLRINEMCELKIKEQRLASRGMNFEKIYVSCNSKQVSVIPER